MSRKLNFQDAIVLVSCVKTKLSRPSPARELYTSSWFRKVRELVERDGARWFILSAKYGLVAPNTKIRPYNLSLNDLGALRRREWAELVLRKLRRKSSYEKRIVIFAGRRYYEFLTRPLRKMGFAVELPLRHLTRGEQLSWLSKRSS